MKRIGLIFSLALCCGLQLQAHVYDPMLAEGKRWECDTWYGQTVEYKVCGDTVIDDVAYKKVFKSSQKDYGDSQFHYFGAARDHNRRTYIIYAEGSEPSIALQSRCDPGTGELLLYDFSLGGITRTGVEGGLMVGGMWADNILQTAWSAEAYSSTPSTARTPKRSSTDMKYTKASACGIWSHSCHTAALRMPKLFQPGAILTTSLFLTRRRRNARWRFPAAMPTVTASPMSKIWLPSSALSSPSTFQSLIGTMCRPALTACPTSSM